MQLYDFLYSARRKLHLFVWKMVFSNSFKHFGAGSSIYRPRNIQGGKYISIGNNSHLFPGAWLLALKNNDVSPEITISDNCYIGHYVHIVSVNQIVIEDSVLIADKVYISDNLHSFDNINIPIKDQAVVFKKTVRIKSGAWIGENACVIGATVGKNSVVAANSVVTKDVPDYSVVAGAPARIIKRYCHDLKTWVRVAVDE